MTITDSPAAQSQTIVRRHDGTKLLVTVAHPDDEAFGLGSLLAHASANAMTTVVACATRGELGEASGVSGGPGGDSPAAELLGAIREAELRAATASLGVDCVHVLGWRDSGMDGHAAPGSLAAAPPTEVADAIARLIDEVRPDIVITPDGSDGHRDHAVVRDATLAAIERSSWRPSRTYLWCLPRSAMAAFTGNPEVGTPDALITTVVDTTAYLDKRWNAIRAHASQSPPFDAMTPELQHAFLATDHLIRLDPPWTGGPIERDWRG